MTKRLYAYYAKSLGMLIVKKKTVDKNVCIFNLFKHLNKKMNSLRILYGLNANTNKTTLQQ